MIRALLLFCLLPLGTLHAQDSVATKTHSIPLLTLKTNATTLLNTAKTSAMLTADLRLARRWSVDMGVGSFLFSSFFANDPGEHYYGLRARAGFKYFYSLRSGASWHVGVEGKYNDVNHAYWERVLRQGGQFEQIILIDRKVKSKGAALRTGVQFYFNSDRRLFLDVYTGIGFMANNVTESSRPPDAERSFREGLFVLFSRDDFRYPLGRQTKADLLLGLHIGYAFW